MKTIVKYHIRKLTVLVAGEKQLFQIKLPRDAKKITGVLITVKPYQRIKGRPKEPPIFQPPIKEPIKIFTPVKAEIALAETQKLAAKKEPLIPIEHAI